MSGIQLSSWKKYIYNLFIKKKKGNSEKINKYYKMHKTWCNCYLFQNFFIWKILLEKTHEKKKLYIWNCHDFEWNKTVCRI